MAPLRLWLVAHSLNQLPALLALVPPGPHRQYFGSNDRVRRGSPPAQTQVDTTATPRAPPRGNNSPSSCAQYRGSSFSSSSSSLGLEESCPPQTEKQRQQRKKQHRRRRVSPRWKESWDNHRHARRPFSATNPLSSSKDMTPLAPVEGPGKRVFVGRAVSTSCSPVRLRRSSASTAAAAEVRPAGNEGHARRGGVAGIGGGGGSEVVLARSSTDISRRGAASGGVGTERLSGGMVGFFSPSGDRMRVRLLK